MAQDFERYLKQDITLVGSPTVLRAAANSDDAIIGIRCANTSGTAVNISVYVKNGSDTYFIIKDAPIPVPYYTSPAPRDRTRLRIPSSPGKKQQRTKHTIPTLTCTTNNTITS